MNSIFLTGMGRSGTTLLEKLLHNHEKISILSQPFPLLFVELKKLFLSSIGQEKYYVLNDSIYENNYEIEDFKSFLDNYITNKKGLVNIFKTMNNYSGQIEKITLDNFFIETTGFVNLYIDLVTKNTRKNHIIYNGSKEILCEEYLPYFCENNIKCIVIIRDPRDVLTSANYPKAEKYYGDKKPSLFILRSWRKSIEFVYFLKNNKNFYFLRYEDLVSNPYLELNKITYFLKLPEYNKNQFDTGIFDQFGHIWQANSSFSDPESFISEKSVGIYKRVLNQTEIDYVEAICEYEMKWLNYPVKKKNKIEIIKSFVEQDVAVKNLSENFSSNSLNIQQEMKRLEMMHDFYQ